MGNGTKLWAFMNLNKKMVEKYQMIFIEYRMTVIRWPRGLLGMRKFYNQCSILASAAAGQPGDPGNNLTIIWVCRSAQIIQIIIWAAASQPGPDCCFAMFLSLTSCQANIIPFLGNRKTMLLSWAAAGQPPWLTIVNDGPSAGHQGFSASHHLGFLPPL